MADRAVMMDMKMIMLEDSLFFSTDSSPDPEAGFQAGFFVFY